MICKRTKGGAAHYVRTVVMPRGTIEYLTPDRTKAADLTAEQVEAMRKYYKDRPAAGTLTFEPVEKPAEKSVPVPKTAPPG